MQPETIRINNMLLSHDIEMREFGRIVLRQTRIKSKLEKVLLLLNSNIKERVDEGALLFLTQARDMKILKELISLLNEHGYSSNALNGLNSIENNYRGTKKTSEHFWSELRLHKNFKGDTVESREKISYVNGKLDKSRLKLSTFRFDEELKTKKTKRV